jgi:hypothetical protein
MLAGIALACACLTLLACAPGKQADQDAAEATATPPTVIAAPATSSASLSETTADRSVPTEALRSFRYTLEVRAANLDASSAPGAPAERVSVTTHGAVADGRHQWTAALDLGFGPITTERIAIGSQHWTRDGAGPWLQERTDTPPLPFTLGIDPSMLAAPDSNPRFTRILTPLPSTADILEGVEARRYELSVEEARSLIVPGSRPADTTLTGESTLWVTRVSALPVRMLIEGTDSQGMTVRVQLDLRDHNAGDISIAPPV